MQSTQTLRAEHDAVLVVLDQLERAASAAARGVPVPRDIFTDIQEFFTVFVDRCHHGKEEAAVFDLLAGDETGGRVAAQLTAEHDAGRALSRAYADAVAGYVPGDAASGRHLAEAARAYDAMLREHIAEENRELFEVMERELADRDAAISQEFDRIEAEEIGEGTHERLHGMIDSLPGRIDPWVSAARA